MDKNLSLTNDAALETSKEVTEESHLTIEIPTGVSAGAQPVCECRLCCNGSHSGPPN